MRKRLDAAPKVFTDGAEWGKRTKRKQHTPGHQNNVRSGGIYSAELPGIVGERGHRVRRERGGIPGPLGGGLLAPDA